MNHFGGLNNLGGFPTAASAGLGGLPGATFSTSLGSSFNGLGLHNISGQQFHGLGVPPYANFANFNGHFSGLGGFNGFNSQF